ncbi:MAG: ATP-dependent helicase, partial [Planctomycetes bacterium]|nr:ATP-dependent helicase [Planctomycetota bacterium]
AAAHAAQQFHGLIASLQEKGKGRPLAKLVSLVIDKTDYHRELERTYPDPNDREARTASLEEIVNAAANYQQRSSEPTLRGFLDEIALGTRDSSDDKQDQLQNNAIALMTMHSAKGLEFPYVYLVGMEEGILPHKRSLETEGDAIDEERRLCYVGVTRAQEQLTLSFALTRRKWGKPRETVPSRFLYEMTGQAENVSAKRPAVSGQRSAAS